MFQLKCAIIGKFKYCRFAAIFNMNNAPNHHTLQVDITNRQILSIALPISLAMLVPQINFITNNIFLGQLGERELGSAGITGVFYLVFALIGNGLHSGFQGLIARRAGENRPREIGLLFGQAIRIALLFAAAGIFITLLLGPLFFRSALHSPAVSNEAAHFMLIRIWGLPFLYLFQLGNAFLVGTLNSRYMKYAFAVEACLNIFLDYVLIGGRWGFPKLGFNGAAVASVIAEVTAVLIVYSIIIYKKFHLRFNLFQHLRYNVALSGLILKQSAPLVLQWLLSVGAWLLFYVLIENSGERPLAISNTMRNIFGFFGIFTWAFASTTNTMVGNIIGQGKKEKVIGLIKKIMWLSLGFTILLCALVNLFPDLFFSIYSNNAGFISEGIPVIRIVSIGLLFMSVATVWLNAVTGTGNTKINLLIEIAAIVLYTVYIYLVMKVWNLGLVWAWGSEIIYWITLFSFSYWYLQKGNWRNKEI
jgi:MATE family multidrug resistance protein